MVAIYGSLMAPEGEYEPSPSDFAREQVEEYESSGGQRGNTPGYAEYQVNTDREIPVLVASRR